MNKKCPICKDECCENILKEKNGVLARYGFLDKKSEKEIGSNNLNQNIYFCNNCDFAWNISFEYDKIKYDSDAIIEAGNFSNKYMEYQYNTASYLNKIMGFIPKVMVEIGAGAGIFIKQFKSEKKIAIEPSDEAKRIDKSITVYNDYYSKDKFNFMANLVVSRQVLEHISDPILFIEDIISSFKKEGEEFYIYLEVPNSMLTFREGRFYDYYYEHCNYFSVNSLIALSQAVNMNIIDVSTGMDGEVISILISDQLTNSKILTNKIEKNKENLNLKLKASINKGKKIFAWGASGNGVQILNVLKLNTEIVNFVIDSDINKQGKFVPGTLQQIISPKEAVKYSPDIIIVLTQFHKNEILEQCKEYFNNAEVWFV